jgi:hypothetical protein
VVTIGNMLVIDGNREKAIRYQCVTIVEANIWHSNMTKAQKEQYVIQLYEEEKNYKEIAKLTHKSIRDISAIIKGHQENIERESGQSVERDDDCDIKSKSETTQAIKLFSEDKTLIDVAIALDLPPDDVQEMHRQYLQLKNVEELVKLFDEVQNYLPEFLELFRIFHARGLGKNEILEIIRVIVTRELPYMLGKIDDSRKELNWLENEIRRKEQYLWILNQKIKDMSYKGRIIPMSNTTSELTYRPDPLIYNDPSVRPLSSNMSSTRSDRSCKSIEDMANGIIDRWASNVRFP